MPIQCYPSFSDGQVVAEAAAAPAPPLAALHLGSIIMMMRKMTTGITMGIIMITSWAFHRMRRVVGIVTSFRAAGQRTTNELAACAVARELFTNMATEGGGTASFGAAETGLAPSRCLYTDCLLRLYSVIEASFAAIST